MGLTINILYPAEQVKRQPVIICETRAATSAKQLDSENNKA